MFLECMNMYVCSFQLSLETKRLDGFLRNMYHIMMCRWIRPDRESHIGYTKCQKIQYDGYEKPFLNGDELKKGIKNIDFDK